MAVTIVDYDDRRHREAFKSLNERWIGELFEIEPADIYELSHPAENIVDKGGFIFMAEMDGKPVGSFALMRSARPKYDYELVKFAVDPRAQGMGVGRLLMERCMEKAREVGARRLLIETNRRCEAAIHLYALYGFEEIPVAHTEFVRADVHMERILPPPLRSVSPSRVSLGERKH